MHIRKDGTSHTSQALTGYLAAKPEDRVAAFLGMSSPQQIEVLRVSSTAEKSMLYQSYLNHFKETGTLPPDSLFPFLSIMLTEDRKRMRRLKSTT